MKLGGRHQKEAAKITNYNIFTLIVGNYLNTIHKTDYRKILFVSKQ